MTNLPKSFAGIIKQQKLLADMRTDTVVNLADYKREKSIEQGFRHQCSKYGVSK